MRALSLVASLSMTALVLALSNGGALAESRWLIIHGDDGAYGYDAGTIETDAESGMKVVTVGMYLPEPAAWDDTPYNFMIEEAQYDCVAEEYSAPLIALFDDNLEPTGVKQGRNWATVHDNGVAKIIFEAVCNGRKISQAVPAGDDTAAMHAMKAFFK